MRKTTITISFLIGIIALTTISIASSFAWYSMGVTNRIDAVDVTIDADRELYIDTVEEPEEMRAELKYEELNQVNVFAPVTTAHRATWMDEKGKAPKFYDDTIYYPSESVPSLKEVDTGYFSQDLYLFSDDDVYVTIDPNTSYIKPNEEYNKRYAAELYKQFQASNLKADLPLKELSEEDIFERLNEIVKAMRFSILILSDVDAYDYIIIDPYKDGDTLLGGVLDNDSDQYYDYYHDTSNISYERIYGDMNDRDLIVYDEASETDSELKFKDQEANAFNAKHKAGVRAFNYEASKENGFEFLEEGAYSLEEFKNRVNSPLNIPVYKNKANRINVSIYIEGYDLNSVNYTMGATFLASLDFVISREM